MIVIVFWAIDNLFLGYFVWVYDYDSFLVISTVWLMIMIVSWAIENNLVYLRAILADQ